VLNPACIPAEEPAQLAATPGPPVIVTYNTYTSQAFQTWYPPDWRVVSSAAFAEPWVVFANADDSAFIVVATNPDDIQIMPEHPRQAQERIRLSGDTQVIAALIAPDATYLPLYTRLIKSLQLP